MSSTALLPLLLLLFLFKSKKTKPRPAVVYHPAPAPAVVPPVVLTQHTPAPIAPWPVAVPAGLPPFPGPGWVPDSPPPPPVVSRAFQLLPQLWALGQGASKTEQTAGRWITYVARMIGTKRSVIAYRLASPAPVPIPSVMPAVAPPPHAATPAPAVFVSTAPAPAPPAGLPMLRLTHPNMKGPSVIHLQQRLGLNADGVFGSGTDAAVKQFQIRHGLKPDGIVGPATWHALG
jgi:hypothetical protein